MIDVKGIQINNWFIDYDGKPFEWSLNDFYLVAQQDVTVDEIIKEPIRLSPEVLEQLGFEKKVLGTVTFYWCFHFGISLFKKKYYLRGTKFYMKGLEYVHQLQNLYFSLTGEELTFKQPEKV